ncbi:hypothetical protein F4802DRAFT_216064 [Xylaria palmicola]|nr:hypothetical protein F4802DRAFT_216064 [Xylaria palmicola]
MPPKRKRREDISSDSEPNASSLRRPSAMSLLPDVMRNIEALKERRNKDRKKIAAELQTHVAGKKKSIRDHYVSETKKRSAETKDLLLRYCQALEQQVSIEKSIEEIVVTSREDLKELEIVLEAAYTGRQQQSRTPIGSFASSSAPGPAAKRVVPAAHSDFCGATDKDSVEIRNGAWVGRDGKDGRARDGNPAPGNHQDEGQVKKKFLDELSW